jgi:hypothetical protein
VTRGESARTRPLGWVRRCPSTVTQASRCVAVCQISMRTRGDGAPPRCCVMSDVVKSKVGPPLGLAPLRSGLLALRP